MTVQNRRRAQQQQHQAATNNNDHHKHAATMPKNPTTKQALNGGSKAGPYQVQEGGSKGTSGTSMSQEKGGKPAGMSNVSRLRSVGQNDSWPNSRAACQNNNKDTPVPIWQSNFCYGQFQYNERR
jgi:hypothetical protein